MPSGRILIVDDDHDIRQTLSEVLEDEGYLVQSVANGAEALQALREGRLLPALILLDLMMPVMDGFQFRLEQQRDPRIAGIPVVVITAGGNHDLKTIDAVEVIAKPIKLARLLSAIEQHR